MRKYRYQLDANSRGRRVEERALRHAWIVGSRATRFGQYAGDDFSQILPPVSIHAERVWIVFFSIRVRDSEVSFDEATRPTFGFVPSDVFPSSVAIYIHIFGWINSKFIGAGQSCRFRRNYAFTPREGYIYISQVMSIWSRSRLNLESLIVLGHR